MHTRLILLFTLLAAVFGLRAAEYPDFYLRGDFTTPAWNDLRWQFSRSGDVYTLNIASLDGQFKISNEDWSVNFGASSPEQTNVYGSTTVTGTAMGPNFKASDLKNVKISFSYKPGAQETSIRIEADGASHGDVSGLSGTLPVLYINVRNVDGSYNDEIISKDLAHKNYFSGEYWLDLNGCEWMEAEGAASIGSADEPLPLEIKARGNYTRTAFAKKPFKLKLGKKQAMLGMSKSKHFALLAHADDNYGYMRNFTGFNLGQRIGLPWTPSQQPVEVVINGYCRGLYFLTESIRVEEDRVDITELPDLCEDPSMISGGYLVELDNYDEDNQIQMEELGWYPGFRDTLRITFDTPEEYSDIQRRFVTEQFTAMNEAIGDLSDDLWAYMDMDDAVRYYIVREMMSDVEAFHGSTYMYRDHGADQKWHFSPIWDCGNGFNGPTDDFFYNHGPYGNTWIASIRSNYKFMGQLAKTWKWFMTSEFDGFYKDLETYRDRIAEAAKTDRDIWKDAPVPDGGQRVVDNSDMAMRHRNVVDHLKAKINWLKEKFGDYTAGTFTEPERDATPAAELPEYVISFVQGVTADAPFDLSAEGIRYYTLSGNEVAAPAPGEICIAVTPDGRAAKVTVK